MGWGFETDPEFQEKLDWVEEFVREEVEPLDLVIDHAWNIHDPVWKKLVPPLQAKVKEKGLWAAHLGPHLGGPGFGQLKLALLNEILGRTRHGPIVFGCQAPDSGNAEILAHFGTDYLKKTYLEPLLANEMVSAFSMTEPQGGSDPTSFVTRAELDGDEWVINGEKWFSSNARYAEFLILLAVTDPEAAPHQRMSMFVVPKETPGVTIVRNVHVYGHAERAGGGGDHAYIRYENARIPADHILGGIGQGFAVAQTRLGGGRIHHAMRTVGLVRQAFDMMCERALSRETRGETLARKQLVQAKIAESWAQIEQFRLLVLRTAWKIDRYNDYEKVRVDIGAVKALMPGVLHDVASNALQIHGSLGVSDEMPFGFMIMESYHMGLADGATEVHKANMARSILKGYQGTDDLFPTTHLPRLRAAARTKFADALAADGA
ncbi:acyl-CoA dehydrogenase family protein [Georgenia ruanii]|uniref:Acyl-CoA dehydrogenase n=1 Tax=Georgenia ruanii TaxID=348442 RepID=A0A7J9V1J0_9MICO|nr:acyl-CoA dehydrogenase family protein [Georgenia ruanii]MPV90473.1 acyl-CoA dehydrogenase [Georgenia ruanii]